MDITMPQLGETVTEGTVTRWLKQVGDQVAPDELIFEVSTDKVDSEVPAPGGGYLVEILVPEGETVPVGTRLAVLGDAPPSEGGGGGGGEAATAEAAPAEAPAQQPAAEQQQPVEAVETVGEPVPEAAGQGGGLTGGSEADEPAGARAEAAAATAEAEQKDIPTGAEAAGGPQGGGQAAGGGTPSGAPGQPAEEAPAPGPESGNGHGTGSGMLLSPVVRRLVAEHNLDPTQIPGTGEGGRVTRSDVLAYIDRQGGAGRQGPAAQPSAPAPAGAAPSAPSQAPAPAPAPAAAQTAPARPAARAGDDEVVPFDNMRRRTAEHMVRSKHTSPHVLTAVEVDFHGVERARTAHQREWKDREGFSLTYLPFMARAVCDALAEFPHLNASVGEDELTVHHYVNLGIAVDLDQRGLIVPVIKNAEGKRLRQLSREIRDLADRARNKKLMPDDVTGGTFTITNPGPYGTLISAPIINQPQVAILSTDGIKKKPVVVETPAGDSIAIHPVGLVAMSWDHRAIDGAYASKFLHHIRTIVETRDWEAELA
ncbi:MAG TPA: dihydrolipoamide acetyltransferase family protein [Acidimicrobiia bacterium]|nr:dihydrolipoamide acetyltransferase family protein [Acidimicrobiia bacterium]